MVLLFKESNIAVCGDAANIRDGELAGPNPVHTYDMEEGMKSLEKIKTIGAKGLVAYHGGYLELYRHIN
jgi:glyoxylase-like metal-dependent hydrolase (beta-lactamase superfamily II)